jgi:hypothetical protein
MDSDAKEFGHVHAADHKIVWACQGLNVIIQYGVGNSTPSRASLLALVREGFNPPDLIFGDGPAIDLKPVT